MTEAGLVFFSLITGMIIGAIIAHKVAKGLGKHYTESLHEAVSRLKKVLFDINDAYNALTRKIDSVYDKVSGANEILDNIYSRLDNIREKLSYINDDIKAVDKRIAKLIRVIDRRFQFRVQVNVTGDEAKGDKHGQR